MSGARRALAIAASVVLHGALAAAVFLLAREPLRRAFTPAGAVEIGVVYREPPPVEAPAARPEPAPLRPGRPARPAPAAAPVVAGPVAPGPQQEPGPAPLEEAPAGVGEVAQEGPGLAVAAGPGTAEVGTPGGSLGGEGASSGNGPGGGTGEGGQGGEGGEGPDARVLEEITRRLAAVASECYPRAAKRLRLQGAVRLRFCVGAGGEALDARVVEGSGAAVLDEAALGCVLSRAAPFPAVPVCLAVPVRFRLSP